MKINPKLAVLKAILGANSAKQIRIILRNAGLPITGTLLVQDQQEENTMKGFRIFLLILSILLIVGITSMSYIGGAYISEYAGPIALIFGALDLTIIIILFANAVKEKFRFVLLAFEILSLAYLGYAMSGYFGGGNLRTAVTKKISVAEEVESRYYSDAATVADLWKEIKSNAATMSDVEKHRDGPGVVSEKADIISAVKIDPIDPPVPIDSVPHFSSLSDANKWLQQERSIIQLNLGRYKSAINAMKNSAKSNSGSLEEAEKIIAADSKATSAQQRISNLQVLDEDMKQIVLSQQTNASLPDDVLAPKDLKADGFQNYVGYIIDAVLIVFVFLLALQKKTSKKFKEIRSAECRTLIEEILAQEDISYDAELMFEVPIEKQYEALKLVLNSDDLKMYLKQKTSFDKYVSFMKEYPEIARDLGNSPWTIVDIKKEIEADSSFMGIAVNALKLNPGQWKTVKAITPYPEHLFSMDEDSQKKFLEVLKQIELKAKFKTEDLKNFMGQFLVKKNMSPHFMQTLETCATKLNSADKLSALNSSFVNTASPKVAEYLCTKMENGIQFKKVVNGWNEQIDESLSHMLINNIAEEASFDRFMTCILDWGGIDGLKKTIKAYSAKKKECDSTSIGNKVMVLRPNFEAIQDALKNKEDEKFLNLLESAIVVENSATNF